MSKINEKGNYPHVKKRENNLPEPNFKKNSRINDLQLDVKKNSGIVRNLIDPYKSKLNEIKSSVINHPFGFAEQRFRWQTNYKNKNSHSIDIKGKPPSKLKFQYDYAPEIKKILSGTDETKIESNYKIQTISKNKKLVENLISKRVINPVIDVKINFYCNSI